jgi:hypothetical protein
VLVVPQMTTILSSLFAFMTLHMITIANGASLSC